MTSSNLSPELYMRTVECITGTTNVELADSAMVPSSAKFDESKTNSQLAIADMKPLSLCTMVTSDVLTITSHKVLQAQQHGNDTVTNSGLKKMSATNGVIFPHQIPVAPREVMHEGLAIMDTSSESSVQEVQESGNTESKKCVVLHYYI